jgi:acylphosphatase
MNVRIGVRISGRVQGVNYRYATWRQAQALGVSGWVRNHYNGDVEGCFEGEEAAVTALVEWCRSGPPAARVDRVTVSRQEYTGEFQGFMITG